MTIRISIACIFSLLAAWPFAARAEEPEPMQLFQRARERMRDGNYRAACPLFEESQRLDPGIGTEFNLARCYELVGRLASAWRLYREVAVATHASGQNAREAIARERMLALEPRLAHVVMRTSQRLDLAIGQDARAAMATELDEPVDIGNYEVVASAPGKRTWRKRIVIELDGERQVIEVPPLDNERTPISMAPPKPVIDSISTRNRSQHTVALGFAGAGVVGAGIGTYFGLLAFGRRNRADGHCDAAGCDPEGVDLRQSSLRAGNLATASFVAAGVLGATAAVVWLTTPSVHRPVRVGIGVRVGGLTAEGRW